MTTVNAGESRATNRDLSWGDSSPETQPGEGVQKVADLGNEPIAVAPTAARGSEQSAAELFPALPAELARGISGRRLGRPTVVTPALIEQVCMLLSIGLSRRQAAIYLGIAPSSLSYAIDR